VPEDVRTAGEWAAYRHPEKSGSVIVNPEWPAFYEDDPVFRCLSRDMQLEPDDLVELLQGD
jgi:hypothetical protein